MSLLGTGVLLTFTEVADADEDDFNQWYNREHLDERVFMPGFRRARRYIAETAAPKYFAIYETATVTDLAQPEYLARLADQSPWSQRVMAGFTVFERLTGTVSVDRMRGLGGGVAVLRGFPRDEAKDDLRAWFAETAPDLIARSDMLGACLIENDLAVANAPAKAQGLDFPQAVGQEWAFVAEAADAATALASLGEATARLEQASMAGQAVRGASYRFLFANHR